MGIAYSAMTLFFSRMARKVKNFQEYFVNREFNAQKPVSDEELIEETLKFKK